MQCVDLLDFWIYKLTQDILGTIDGNLTTHWVLNDTKESLLILPGISTALWLDLKKFSHF